MGEKKRNIGLLIAAVMVAFLLCEGFIRLFVPDYVASAGIEQNYFCEFDDEIGWRPIPNRVGLHQRKDFSVSVRLNQFGLRGPHSMQRGRSSSNKRILILGDSYVWGYGVGQSEVFSNPAVHQSKAELINFGVSGYGTDQEYLFYLREGVRFEVDEVVLAVTPYNDLENNLSSKQYHKVKPYYTLAGSDLVLHNQHLKENKIQSVVNWLWANSRAVNLMDKGYRTFQMWQFERQEYSGHVLANPQVFKADAVSVREEEGIQLTVSIIHALREAVLANGAQFSVVFIPYKPHILHNAPHNHPVVFALIQELEEANIDYYEPYSIFLQKKNGENLFNPFDNHFSPAGHALFGKVLVESTLQNTANTLLPGESTTVRE